MCVMHLSQEKPFIQHPVWWVACCPGCPMGREAISTCYPWQGPPDPEYSWSWPNATSSYSFSQMSYIPIQGCVDPFLMLLWFQPWESRDQMWTYKKFVTSHWPGL